MQLRVVCRAGQSGNRTHDPFVLVPSHCARRFSGAQTHPRCRPAAEISASRAGQAPDAHYTLPSADGYLAFEKNSRGLRCDGRDSNSRALRIAGRQRLFLWQTLPRPYSPSARMSMGAEASTFSPRRLSPRRFLPLAVVGADTFGSSAPARGSPTETARRRD